MNVYYLDKNLELKYYPKIESLFSPENYEFSEISLAYAKLRN